MILLFSLLLLIADFISFFIYNTEAVENNLTNRQKRLRKKKNFLKRYLFIGEWNHSGKVFWICHLINVLAALVGTIIFLITLFYRNAWLENYTLLVLIIQFLLTTVFAAVSKLAIHIAAQKSAFGAAFLSLVLIAYIISLIALAVA